MSLSLRAAYDVHMGSRNGILKSYKLTKSPQRAAAGRVGTASILLASPDIDCGMVGTVQDGKVILEPQSRLSESTLESC